jgi:hypothetical protein
MIKRVSKKTTIWALTFFLGCIADTERSVGDEVQNQMTCTG